MRARLPKLGRTARWILTIGIILIPVIFLAVTYGQNLAEESDLKADIDTANAQLRSRQDVERKRGDVYSDTLAVLQGDIHGITAEVNQTQEYVSGNITGTVALLSDVHSRLGGVNSTLAEINGTFQDVLDQLDQNVTEQFPYNETQSIEIGEELFQAADVANVTISSYTCSLPYEVTIDGVKYQVFSISLSVEGQVPNLLEFLSSWPLSQEFPCDFKSVTINMPEEEGGDASMSFNLEIYCYG
jgi:hypothetical protein